MLILLSWRGLNSLSIDSRTSHFSGAIPPVPDHLLGSIEEGLGFALNRILQEKLLFHIVLVSRNASSKNLKLNTICTNLVPEPLLLIYKVKDEQYRKRQKISSAAEYI